MHQKLIHKYKALSSIEIILSLALFFVLVLGLSSAIFYGLNIRKQVGEDTKANYLLDEGIEALYAIRDSNYGSLIDGTWGLIENSGTWALGGSSDTIDGYVRQIIISSVAANEKDLNVTISWVNGDGNSKSINTSFKLTNFERVINPVNPNDWSNPVLSGFYNLPDAFAGLDILMSDNIAFVVQNSATHDFTVLNTTNPNDIQLLANLKSDASGNVNEIVLSGQTIFGASSANGKEVFSLNVTDLLDPVINPSLNLDGTADGLGSALDGNYLYISRGASASKKDPEFHIIDISNPAAMVETAALDLGENLTVYDVTVSGNYAYLATSSNNSELMVIDITNKNAPAFVSALDLASNNDGYRIEVDNGIVYLALDNGIIHLININNPNIPAPISSFNAGGQVGGMKIGLPAVPYLFLATANTTQEFQVVNISNINAPVLYGSYNAAAALRGVDYDPVRDLALAIGNEANSELIIFQGAN
jgi:hypothetical protein